MTAGYVNEVWIQKGTPLYVLIPALAVVLGHLCDEWQGVQWDDEEDFEEE